MAFWIWVTGAQSGMGWGMAAGLAVLIFIHEMGHVVMNWKNGIKSSPPMFIPFVGALIAVKSFPEDPVVESECGAGGPVAGMLSSAVCLGIAWSTGVPFWWELAGFGFAINLFNLLPLGPLDGARIGTALAPRNWDFLLITLLLVTLKLPLAIWWLFLVMLFAYRLGRVPQGRHNLAAPAARARMTLVLLGLLVGLGWGTDAALFGGPKKRPSTPPAASATAQPRPADDTPPAIAMGTSVAQKESGLAAFSKLPPLAQRFLGLILLLSMVLCALPPCLAALASGERFGSRGWLAFAGLLAAHVLVIAVNVMVPPAQGGMVRGTLPGWTLGLLASVVFLIHQWVHVRLGHVQPNRDSLHRHALAWGAAAALAVAYARNSLPLLVVVLLLTALYLTVRPAVALALLAVGQEWRGQLARAAEYRVRALGRRPGSDLEKELRLLLADTRFQMGQAREALECLDLAVDGPGSEAVPQSNILRWFLHARALVALERYADAMRICERLLRVPHGERSSNRRTALVRDLLGEMAESRGWSDEALAQAEVQLSQLPANVSGEPAELLLRARWRRAVALAAQGRPGDALKELHLAHRWVADRAGRVALATNQARVSLERRDWTGAGRYAEAAVSRMPDAIEPRLLQAEAHFGAGKPEGEEYLRRLAREHGEDRWGRRAASLLGPV